MCNQNNKIFLVSWNRNVKHGDEVHSLFSQEFKQSGAFRIADLGSFNSILLNPKIGRTVVNRSLKAQTDDDWIDVKSKEFD